MDDSSRQLGQDPTVYRFETAEDCFNLSLELVAQATRSLRLVSWDLEKGFYDRDRFVDAVSSLARRNRHTEIRILIADVKPLVSQFHAMLALIERLPSKIELRVMDTDYPNTSNSFLLVDSAGVMFREEPTLYQGFICFSDAARVKQLGDVFEAMWQRAAASPELRRLGI